MADVALAAGVSPATVSYVFSRQRPIGASTRARVLDVAHRLGYQPSALGRSLAARRSHLVALAVALQAKVAYDDPYFVETLRGVATICAESGYLATLLTPASGETLADACLRLWGEQRIDGCILTAVPDGDPTPRQLHVAGLPYVILGSVPGAPCVEVDNRGATRAITRHLLFLGHRRFAYVDGLARLAGLRDLLAGFHEALAERSDLPPPLVLQGDSTLAGGYRCTQDLLELGRDRLPTAVVCANDLLAAGVMQALYDHGVRVPEEVSVTGIDDSPLATVVRPRLTTVRKPVAELGAQAMRMLLEAIMGRSSASPVPAPMTLVPRESTGPATE